MIHRAGHSQEIMWHTQVIDKALSYISQSENSLKIRFQSNDVLENKE